MKVLERIFLLDRRIRRRMAENCSTVQHRAQIHQRR
jgi:hypothetical protein